ncbi:MAG: ABC transporter substrate-binding protein [bacterium]|nr:ABC transporter substrate-binding protein [bacterium]
MKKRNIFLFPLFFAIFAAVLIGGGCDIFEKDTAELSYTNPIKIGLLSPLGDFYAWAESINLAAFLAAEEINNAGGLTISGVNHDIELVIRDTSGSTSKGLAAIEDLYNEGVRIILGPSYSSVGLGDDTVYGSGHQNDGVFDFAIENHMIILSYSATSADITSLTDSSLVWRTCPSDALQGEAAADYAYALGKRNASVTYIDDAWGRGLDSSFSTAFAAKAGAAMHERISIGETYDEYSDYTSIITSLFPNTDADLVFLVTFPNQGARIINDIISGGHLAPFGGSPPLFFGNDGIKSNDFLVNGNSAIIEGMYGTVPGSGPGYSTFLTNFRTRFDFDPDSFSEFAYDGVYVLAYAIQNAQPTSFTDTTELDKIAAKLATVANDDSGETVISVNEFAAGKAAIGNDGSGDINYEGVSGSIEFDANGDPASGIYDIWKIVDNAYVTQTTVTVTP